MLDDVSSKMLHNLTYFCNIQKHTLHGIFLPFYILCYILFSGVISSSIKPLISEEWPLHWKAVCSAFRIGHIRSFLKIYESGDQNYIWKDKKHEKLIEKSVFFMPERGTFLEQENSTQKYSNYDGFFSLFEFWILNYSLPYHIPLWWQQE